MTATTATTTLDRQKVLNTAAAPEERTAVLARLLRALASDCESTDGWEDAAPDLHEAADFLTAFPAAVATFAAPQGLKNPLEEGPSA